jgi:hypothetical protein
MEAFLQSVAEESRRGRIRLDRARNLKRARSFASASLMRRNRNKEYRGHHKHHRTDHRRSFVSLAAIHRAIVHPGHFVAHFGRHIVAAVFVPRLTSGSGVRVRRSFALVMMLRNIAEPSRAAGHRRRRKRSRRQRRVQKRNRQQASQRAQQSQSIVVSAIQVQSKRTANSKKPAL